MKNILIILLFFIPTSCTSSTPDDTNVYLGFTFGNTNTHMTYHSTVNCPALKKNDSYKILYRQGLIVPTDPITNKPEYAFEGFEKNEILRSLEIEYGNAKNVFPATEECFCLMCTKCWTPADIEQLKYDSQYNPISRLKGMNPWLAEYYCLLMEAGYDMDYSDKILVDILEDTSHSIQQACRLFATNEAVVLALWKKLIEENIICSSTTSPPYELSYIIDVIERCCNNEKFEVKNGRLKGANLLKWNRLVNYPYNVDPIKLKEKINDEIKWLQNNI